MHELRVELLVREAELSAQTKERSALSVQFEEVQSKLADAEVRLSASARQSEDMQDQQARQRAELQASQQRPVQRPVYV